MPLQPNNLISFSSNNGFNTVDVRIQFVVDVASVPPNQNQDQDLQYYYYNIVTQAFETSAVKSSMILGDIYDELSICWIYPSSGTEYKVIMNAGLPAGPRPGLDVMNARDGCNPFKGETFIDPLLASPTPLVRFYVGEGASLTTDNSGSLAKAIPGYARYLATKTSFFERNIDAGLNIPKLNAGYLFTNSKESVAKTFMHELGHVLGLADRYVEGIYDAGPPAGKYVNQPVRATPPLSKEQIDAGVAFFENSGSDPNYDPLNNLMSNKAYKLSQYQGSVIARRVVEERYIEDNFLVLLFHNPACKSGSNYRPTTVGLNQQTNVRQVVYEASPNSAPLHNALFPGDPNMFPLRYQATNDTSSGVSRDVIGPLFTFDEGGFQSDTIKMIMNFFDPK